MLESTHPLNNRIGLGLNARKGQWLDNYAGYRPSFLPSLNNALDSMNIEICNLARRVRLLLQ